MEAGGSAIDAARGCSRRRLALAGGELSPVDVARQVEQPVGQDRPRARARRPARLAVQGEWQDAMRQAPAQQRNGGNAPDARVYVFQESTNRANGLTRDIQDWPIACENDRRRVRRQELDGGPAMIANSLQRRRNHLRAVKLLIPGIPVPAQK